jgi:hypothetical protein
MVLSKPRRRTPSPKIKQLLTVTAHNREAVSRLLTNAAATARYAGSPYHRVRGSKMGSSVDRLWPDASKCDPRWTRELANRALKSAIQDCHVSAAWVSGFPRMVWCFNDGILYEARLSNSGSGEYHAYPLEDEREWPKEMRDKKTAISWLA